MNQVLPDGWCIKAIEDLGKIYSGATPSTNLKDFWDGDIVWVTPNDLSQLRTRFIHSSARKLTTVGLQNCSARLLPPKSLVLSSRAPIGYLALPTTNFCTNQGCKTIVFNPDQDPEFHYYNLLFRVNAIREKGAGTTFHEISKTSLGSIEVPVPSAKAVQSKIAKVLSIVDRAIEQTEALIAKYQRIKTGLMQDLLTRGLDERGQLRDPATHQFKPSPLGMIPIEWDVVTVEQTGEVKLGRQRSPQFQTGHYRTPYLRVANVFDGWIDYGDVLQMDFKPSEREIYGLILGDILLNEGQSLELVGRSAIFDGPQDIYCFQNTLVRFRCNETTKPNFCQSVFKYWLDTGKFQLVAKQTTSVAHLGAERFARMPFARPKVEEQTRISQVLGAHNEVLELERRRLAKLHRLKTGLMQDLLTGKVSVEPLLDATDGLRPSG